MSILMVTLSIKFVVFQIHISSICRSIPPNHTSKPNIYYTLCSYTKKTYTLTLTHPHKHPPPTHGHTCAMIHSY